MKSYSILLQAVLLCLLFPQCKPSQKAALKESDQQQAVTTIFLVRHAEKAKEGGRDPVLTQEGQERAQRLSQQLSVANIQHVYSTDYIRTRSTAKPTASHFGLETVIYNPRDTSFYQSLLTKHQGENILVVGHSNSTPKLVNQLLGKKQFKHLKETEYDKLFLITRIGEQGHCTLLSY